MVTLYSRPPDLFHTITQKAA